MVQKAGNRRQVLSANPFAGQMRGRRTAREKEAGSGASPEPVMVRYTIDERFDDSLIRVLAAPLRKEFREAGKEVRLEDLRLWGAETASLLTRPRFVKQVLDSKYLAVAVETAIGKLTRKPELELLWQGLQEGQVFIFGNFLIKGERFDPECLMLARQPVWDFLRIDRAESFKNASKSLYSKALRGEEAR
jgi:hypothetical protein